MPTEFSLRRATPADASRIAALGLQVWLHTYATEGVNDAIADYVLQRFTAANMRALIADPARCVWLAESQSQLIAYATLYRGPAAHGNELETLYVQEHFAGHGVGRALLQQARQEIRDCQATPLWLMVNAQNARAIAFYRRMGMVEDGIAYFELDGVRHKNLVMRDIP